MIRPKLILTDLDGTLLGPDYNAAILKPLLNHLNHLGIPVIPITSKTLGEIALLSREAPIGRIGQATLYVAELGGAVYATPHLLKTTIPPKPSGFDGLLEYPLATPLETLSSVIDRVVREAGCSEKVIRVSMESPNLLSSELGLPPEQARWARERRYDEVLIPETHGCARKLVKEARSRGLDAVSGGLHVHVGRGIGKERAINLLEDALLNVIGGKITSVSLCMGDSPIDWGFLEQCTVRGVIPRRQGASFRSAPRPPYLTAPFPAPRGWSWLVERHVLLRAPE